MEDVAVIAFVIIAAITLIVMAVLLGRRHKADQARQQPEPATTYARAATDEDMADRPSARPLARDRADVDPGLVTDPRGPSVSFSAPAEHVELPRDSPTDCANRSNTDVPRAD